MFCGFTCKQLKQRRTVKSFTFPSEKTNQLKTDITSVNFLFYSNKYFLFLTLKKLRWTRKTEIEA